ncbi:MAG: hypothetical protein M3441_20260 [Chloroflexota bacterium]|nr:hypothetical protein [Chloroflexota bacterium]
MKEIRGAKAIRYADENGIDFNIDEGFLTRAEGAVLGRDARLADLGGLIERELGRPFDRAELLPGTASFDFLINRHGDGWIYVAVEGANPDEEERVALWLCHRRLKEERPAPGGDIMDLFHRYRPRLTATGFPADAGLNLVFHAALRLVAKGSLVEERDPASGEVMSYGNRLFFAPPSVDVRLAGLICERCRAGLEPAVMRLHPECVRRLRRALAAANTNT